MINITITDDNRLRIGSDLDVEPENNKPVSAVKYIDYNSDDHLNWTSSGKYEDIANAFKNNGVVIARIPYGNAVWYFTIREVNPDYVEFFHVNFDNGYVSIYKIKHNSDDTITVTSIDGVH